MRYLNNLNHNTNDGSKQILYLIDLKFFCSLNILDKIPLLTN